MRIRSAMNRSLRQDVTAENCCFIIRLRIVKNPVEPELHGSTECWNGFYDAANFHGICFINIQRCQKNENVFFCGLHRLFVKTGVFIRKYIPVNGIFYSSQKNREYLNQRRWFRCSVEITARCFIAFIFYRSKEKRFWRS